MKNYITKIQEAHEKREARIDDSLSRLKRRIHQLKSGVSVPSQSEFLFPQMGVSDLIKDLEDKQLGLELAKSITASRQQRRVERRVSRENESAAQVQTIPTPPMSRFGRQDKDTPTPQKQRFGRDVLPPDPYATGNAPLPQQLPPIPPDHVLDRLSQLPTRIGTNPNIYRFGAKGRND